MGVDEPDEPIRQQIEALGLKREVEEMGDGEFVSYEAPDIEPAIAEAYWTQVRDFEQAPWTTYVEILEREGVHLRQPDDVPEEEIHQALWDLIGHLAGLGVFLESTDHLSDRELYTYLCCDGLREWAKDMPRCSGMSYHLSPIGSCTENDMLIYHRYYADEQSRRHWMDTFPDYRMPAREKAPYDRDRCLPQHPLLRWDGGTAGSA